MRRRHKDQAVVACCDASRNTCARHRDRSPAARTRIKAEDVRTREPCDPNPVVRIDRDPVGAWTSSFGRRRGLLTTHRIGHGVVREDLAAQALRQPQHALSIERRTVGLERGQQLGLELTSVVGVELDDRFIVVQADPHRAIASHRDRARNATARLANIDGPQQALVGLAPVLSRDVAIDQPIEVHVFGGLDHSVTVAIDAVLTEARDLGHRSLPTEGAVRDVHSAVQVNSGARRAVAGAGALSVVVAAFAGRRGMRIGSEQHAVVETGLCSIACVELGDLSVRAVGDPRGVHLRALGVEHDRAIGVHGDGVRGVVDQPPDFTRRQPHIVARQLQDAAPGATVVAFGDEVLIDGPITVVVDPVADLGGARVHQRVAVVAVVVARVVAVGILIPWRRSMVATVRGLVARVQRALVKVIAGEGNRGSDTGPSRLVANLDAIAEVAVVTGRRAGRPGLNIERRAGAAHYGERQADPERSPARPAHGLQAKPHAGRDQPCRETHSRRQLAVGCSRDSPAPSLSASASCP